VTWAVGQPRGCPTVLLIPTESEVTEQGSRRKGVMITVIVVVTIALAFYVGAYLYLALV
jgi:hypothetical protein